MMSIVTAVRQTIGGDEAPDEAAVPHSIDVVAGLLSAARRRWILQYLAEHGETTLDTLATERAEEIYGPRYTSDERKRDYVSMYQNHLPELDSAGVIDYEPDRSHVVTPGEHFEGYIAALRALEAICEPAEVER